MIVMIMIIVSIGMKISTKHFNDSKINGIDRQKNPNHNDRNNHSYNYNSSRRVKS